MCGSCRVWQAGAGQGPSLPPSSAHTLLLVLGRCDRVHVCAGPTSVQPTRVQVICSWIACQQLPMPIKQQGCTRDTL